MPSKISRYSAASTWVEVSDLEGLDTRLDDIEAGIVASDPTGTAEAFHWNSAWGVVANPPFTVGVSGTPIASGSALMPAYAFASTAGRRYRYTIVVRALATTGVGDTYLQTNLNGGAWGDSHAYASGSFVNIIQQLKWNGDGTTFTLQSFIFGPTPLTPYVGDQVSTHVTIEDIGPVTGAAVQPTVLQVTSPGNALGIVAMGSMLGWVNATLPKSVTTAISNPLTVTMAIGRRYRIRMSVRAMHPISTVGYVYFRFLAASGAIPPMDSYRHISAQYDSLTFEYVMDGTGATETITGYALCNEDLKVWSDQPTSFFYIEDVGPNSYPALPVPATDPPWTPFPFATGWSDYGGGLSVCGYQKIGARVYLRGLAQQASGATSSMGVLPAGFRPPSQVIGLQMQFASAAHTSVRYDIATTGNFGTQAALGAGNWVNLEGIQFSTTP